MKNCFDRVSKREAYKMTGISADDIRKRVARKLGDAAEEEERTRIRMKKRLILSVVLAALFLVTAAAATSFHISKLIPGNIEQVQEYIQTKPVKKTLGEFEVTVHESLCDENYAYLAVSVRGTTDKAKKQLFNEEFENHHMNWSSVLDVYVEGTLGKERSGMLFQKVESLCTEDTVYMIGELASPNPEHKPVIISLASYFMKEVYPGVTVTDTIAIPFEEKIGSSFTITPNQKVTAHKKVSAHNLDGAVTVKSPKDIESQVTVNKVSLSQLGLRIDYTDDTRCSELYGCIFMQMADGTIRSYNQLFDDLGGSGGGEDNTYHGEAAFLELQDMKKFKALILGTTAYPLDGGKTYQVAIDQKLQPFLLPLRKEKREYVIDPKKRMERLDYYGETYEYDAEAQTITITSDVTHNKGQVLEVGTTTREYDFYPVKDLCDKIGAGYQWDAIGQKVTITYNGRTTVLPVGTSSHPMSGGDNTIEVELELVDGKPYAEAKALNNILGLSWMATEATRANNKAMIIFP